ncbi:girdin-like [Magallana gigas]|uniref:girdin-like n=1 Tax=Magallana gigas TaxID=29159 RepID=UPI00334275DA
MIKDYRKTCWILLIAFFIQQTLRQMSCSTQMIRNYDVINSKISHGTSKTAKWIVTQSENCNPTSTKVAIGRLWSEYEKLRKNKSKTDGSRKFTEFLETEFAPPTLSKTVKSKLPEVTCLINSSGDATSTAISISNSLFMENQNLNQEKFTLKSELSETISNLKTLNIKSENISRKNRVLQENLVSSNKTVKRTKRREDYWKTKCTKLETTTDTTKEDYQQLIYELQADNDQQRTTITELQTALKEKDDQIAYLIEQLQEGGETRVIHLFDKKEKAFTPELHLCVYSLLEHNVPSTQIGPTIEACLKLAGKEPDRLPSPSTVANMNIQRLCLVKKQLEDELPEKINTTLHTDETSKVGIKYGGFSVRDEEDACENIVDFMTGTFPSLTGVAFHDDKIFESLTKESTYDTDVEIILRVLLPSIRKVVLHVYKDHLPNGRYESFTEELSQATKSVDKHNSYSERLFAYMDQILKSKPNISTLAIEAYTLFLMNKTSTWIMRNSENTEVLISEASKSVIDERELFSRRKAEIQRQREERQEEEFQKRAEKRRKKRMQLEKQSDDIVNYGLWKSPRECKLKLKELNRTSDKCNALKAQLRYRKNVLKQTDLDKKLYSFSKIGSNGKRHPLTHMELMSNLLKVLKSV